MSELNPPAFSPEIAVYGKYKDQIIAEEIARQTLERAAKRIEEMRGNEVYEKAWKAAAVVVRSMKP